MCRDSAKCYFLRLVRVFLACLSIVLLLSFPGGARAGDTKHVLVLHSYHSGMSWVSNIEKAIRDTLLVPPFDDLILHIEYMDTKRNHSEAYYSRLQRVLKTKYENLKLSLVLSSDNNAFDFLLGQRDELFPDVPVVFCGVNNFSDESLSDVTGFTGVAEVTSSRATVEAILQQLPDTREIFVVNDYLKTGRAWQATISRELKAFENDVTITYNENLSILQLRKKIQSLKPGSVVLLGVYFSDRDGRYLTYEKLGTALTSDSPVPVYCLLRFNLRDGVIGGKVISGYHQGVLMSEVARRVLSGKNPDEIPVAKIGANAFMFDWKAMERHGIDISTLPEESLVINEPFSFYEEYFQLVWAAAFVFVVMVSLVFVLTRNLVALKATRRELGRSERKYRSIFDNATEGIFQSSFEGKILAANASFVKMLGYDSLDDAMHEIKDLHEDVYVVRGDRERMLNALRQDGKLTGLEVRMKRKDGTRLWMSLNVRLTEGTEGAPILEGTLVDITERRQAKERLLLAKEKVEDVNKALRLNMAQLRTLVESIPELVWVKDVDGIYSFCNKRFERFLGAAEADIVGKTDYDYVDKELADFFRKNDEAAMRAGGPRVNEESIVYSDNGRRVELETIKTPMFDDQGQLVGVLGVGRDISKRKSAERELDRLRNYLFNIINSMPSILVGVDSERRVTLWNRTAEESTGITAASADGELLVDILPRMRPLMGGIAESIRLRMPRREQKVPRRVGSETRYEDVTVYPLITETDEGAVVRIDDITERINLERMMVQSEKMMSVGGLAAGMAHEINNPLAAVIGYAHNMDKRMFGDLRRNAIAAQESGITLDALREYLVKREIPDMLAGISESGERAAKIVSNMLNFSRTSELEAGWFSVVELLDKAVDLSSNVYDMQRQYDFQRIEILREYEDVPKVQCDGNEIQQVFLNLLKNGAEAMAEKEYSDGGPRFILRVRQAGDSVVVEVEDNGPGMDESVRRRSLEPFFTTKPVGDGTGLGLSVSYFIVADLHGGIMEVFSAPGHWSRFVIKIPVEGGMGTLDLSSSPS